MHFFQAENDEFGLAIEKEVSCIMTVPTSPGGKEDHVTGLLQKNLGIQSYSQMMSGVLNHLRIVSRFHETILRRWLDT